MNTLGRTFISRFASLTSSTGFAQRASWTSPYSLPIQQQQIRSVSMESRSRFTGLSLISVMQNAENYGLGAKVTRGSWERSGVDQTYWTITRVVHGHQSGDKFSRNKIYGVMTFRGIQGTKLRRILRSKRKDWTLYKPQEEVLQRELSRHAVIEATNPNSLYHFLAKYKVRKAQLGVAKTNAWLQRKAEAEANGTKVNAKLLEGKKWRLERYGVDFSEGIL